MKSNFEKEDEIFKVPRVLFIMLMQPNIVFHNLETFEIVINIKRNLYLRSPMNVRNNLLERQ